MWTAKPLKTQNLHAVLMAGSHGSNMTHYLTDRFQVSINAFEYDLTVRNVVTCVIRREDDYLSGEDEEMKVAYFKHTLIILTLVQIKGTHMEHSFSPEAYRPENYNYLVWHNIKLQPKTPFYAYPVCFF